jgi:hypothetical protein
MLRLPRCPGHDAWVMADEPVATDQGMTNDRKSESSTIAVSSGRAAARARRRSPGSGTHRWPKART